MEFIDFLKYGAIGISLALAILSYRLLSKEQDKEAVRPEILKSIKNYFMLAVFLSVFFGSAELVLKITGKTGGDDGAVVLELWNEHFSQYSDSTVNQKINRISKSLSEKSVKIDTVNICSSIYSDLESCRSELDTYDQGFYQNIIKLKKAISKDPDGWINLEFQTGQKQDVVDILKMIFNSLGDSCGNMNNSEVVEKWKALKKKWADEKTEYIFHSDVTCLVKEFLSIYN